jgi:hypothetical protein
MIRNRLFLLTLALALVACTPIQKDNPAETMAGPAAPPPTGTTTPPNGDQQTKPGWPTELPPGQTNERLEFTPGANSTHYSGILPSGRAMEQYTLSTYAGQTIIININSGDVPIGLTITSPSGNQRFTETSLADGSYRLSITYTLAEAGDYLIMLTKADRTPGTYYTADIIIQ